MRDVPAKLYERELPSYMEYIKLNNGLAMPSLGYGVFQINDEEAARCVADAIEVGYRLIDTAQAYGNERGVGEGIRRSGVAREDLFLTTKVWISNAGERKAAASIDESLKRLGTDYIDLLLVHQPFGDYYGTWRAMETALMMGKVRAVGVSNFSRGRFTDLLARRRTVLRQRSAVRIGATPPQNGGTGGFALVDTTRHHRHSQEHTQGTHAGKLRHLRFPTLCRRNATRGCAQPNGHGNKKFRRPGIYQTAAVLRALIFFIYIDTRHRLSERNIWKTKLQKRSFEIFKFVGRTG